MFIMSDRTLNIEREYIDLNEYKIANCIGCFGCWTKTPGKCVIRDDATKIYPQIAASDRLIYVNRVKYGGYDTVMKKMHERALPIQQAFIKLVDGEAHHYQRNVALQDAIIIAYGTSSKEEEEIFSELIERNSYNMNFKSYQLIFVEEENIDQEVTKWIKHWS